MRNRIRVLALAALFTALPAAAIAQGKSDATSSGQFVPGTKILSADLLIGGNGDYAGVGVGASFEVGVVQFGQSVTLGLGASIGVIHDSFSNFAYGYSVNQIPIFFIANGHYQLTQVPELDLYGGVSLGIAHVSYSYDNGICDGCSTSTSDVGVGAQIGGRWAFSDNLSAMAQFGEGLHVPILTAGITIKF